MRDDDRATGEAQQRFFERTQGFDVQVVGGFVQQQHVATGAQHFGQMHAVAFTAGQLADDLLLGGALKVETADITARWRLVIADLDQVLSARNLLPDGFLVIQGLA